MSELATVKHLDAPSLAPENASEAAAILQMIERVALNPSADLDKLERLLAMRERVEGKQAERAFNIAMKDAQSEMGVVGADASNPQTRSRYATYAKLDAFLRPIYTRHGFSLSFDEAESPKPEHIRVLCYVSHDAGHTRTYHKDMPADGKGAKGGDVMTKTHAAGAAASYGARYLLKGVFNVAVGEEDRDGNDTAPAQLITQDQIGELVALMESVGSPQETFLKWAGLERLADMRAKDFPKAVNAINSYSPRGRR